VHKNGKVEWNLLNEEWAMLEERRKALRAKEQHVLDLLEQTARATSFAAEIAKTALEQLRGLELSQSADR
jgi:hypothetical protein